MKHEERHRFAAGAPHAGDEIAVCYSRVSAEEQTANMSTRGQATEAQEFCARHGYTLAETYLDEAKSGKSTEGRDELQRMLADARRGKFKHLIVWKLSRLCRNLIDTLTIIEELDRLGISFHSITEPEYDTGTPAGRMFLRVMATAAEFERECLAENVKMGLKQRHSEGGWCGRPMKGYRYPDEHDPEEARKRHQLLIVPEEAETIRLIFNLYAQGKGLRAIANALNRTAEHRSKKGETFGPTQIGKYLDNPAYVGKVRFTVRDARRRVVEVREGDGTHEPIIELELWNRVRALRESRRKTPRRTSGKYPLTGLMVCPDCGRAMTMASATKTRKDGTKKVEVWYVCGQWKRKGASTCHANMMPVRETERTVFRRLKRIVTHPTLLTELVKKINAQRTAETTPIRRRLDAIERERQRLKHAEARFGEAFQRDALTVEEFGAKQREIREALAALTAEENGLSARLDGCGGVKPISVEVVRLILSEFVTQLQAADVDRQKVLLKAFVREITVEKGKGVTGIRLHLHPDVAAALGMADPPNLPAPVALTA